MPSEIGNLGNLLKLDLGAYSIFFPRDEHGLKKNLWLDLATEVFSFDPPSTILFIFVF